MDPELSPDLDPSLPHEAPDRRTGARKSRAGLVVGVAILVGFSGWLGVRIRAALKDKEALAAERTAAAAPKSDSIGAPRLIRSAAESWQPEVSLEGTLMPVREADLGFRVPGRLRSIKVKLGDRVHAGAVLATLDETEAQAQVQAASAQVRAAEAQLALASDAAHRTGKLVGSGAASQASGVQVDQQAQLASAQLDAARAQLALARASLENHVLTAPFAGAVTKVPAGPGAIVNPGVPLFHLQDTSTLKLSATVGEADAALLQPGAKVELRAGAQPIAGAIVAVLSSVDPSTRRVPVEAQVQNDGSEPLRGGVFVRAEVVGLPKVQVMRVPASALRPGSQNELFAVESGRLRARHVLFSRAADGALLVRSGLAANEEVLLSPSPEAQDGDPAPHPGAAK